MAQSSDTPGPLRVPPSEIGKYHRKVLVETTRPLDGQPLFTEKAVDVQIDSLVKQEIIDGGNAETLRAFIRKLLSGQTVEEMYQQLQALAQKLKSAANEVAAAIGSIAEDSLAYVKDFAGKLDKKQLALVIAHDVRGG